MVGTALDHGKMRRVNILVYVVVVHQNPYSLNSADLFDSVSTKASTNYSSATLVQNISQLFLEYSYSAVVPSADVLPPSFLR